MKLHPLTALRDAAANGMRLGSFALFAAVMGATTDLLPGVAAVVLVPLAVLAGGAYGVARYAAFEYELEGNTLAIRSGVFQRQKREIPLGRVQNVDVQQSFLQRLVGVAVVRFETAGGGETEGELALVDLQEAESLQARLRAHRREARADEDAGEPAGAGEVEPTVLFELSVRDLLVLAGVSFRWGVLPVLAFATPLIDDLLVDVVERVVVTALRDGAIAPADPRLLLLAAGGVAAYLLATWVVSGAITVVKYYDFQLARIDDELVYERGLLQRYSGTIPLDKVQTLAVEENVAMRRLGYAALSVETAGYAPGSDGGGSPSAIPLADRETVLSLVSAIEGVEDVGVERPPTRARRRYAGRYVLAALAVVAAFAAVHLLVWRLGVFWVLPATALVAAVPAAHLKWANRGYRSDDDHFLARSGFWRRRTLVVPHYRLQTVLTVRTVFQRRWRLASVVGDTASSSGLRSRDATAHDVDLATARDLHRALRDRLQVDLARRRADRGRRDSSERAPAGADEDETTGTDADETTGISANETAGAAGPDGDEAAGTGVGPEEDDAIGTGTGSDEDERDDRADVADGGDDRDE